MSFECIEVKKNGLEWLLQMSRPCRVGSYNVDHTWLLVTHLTYLRPPTYLRTYAHRHTHPSITDFLYLTLNSVCTHAYVYAAHSARQLINGRGILLNVTMVTAVKLLHKRVDCSWGGWNKTGKKQGVKNMEMRYRKGWRQSWGGLWMRWWKGGGVWKDSKEYGDEKRGNALERMKSKVRLEVERVKIQRYVFHPTSILLLP